MSQTPSSLIETCIAGRYKVSIWGLVPLPRRVRRMPPGIDPDYAQSLKYEALIRCLDRKKPVGWPVQNHSMIEVEDHLRQAFQENPRIERVVSQADVYLGAFVTNRNNHAPLMREALRAFIEIWRIVNSRLSDSCPKCDLSVKKRLALNGFVS